MQHLRLWRILLGVIGGVALVALSVGLLAAAPVQAAGVPNRADLVDRAVNQPEQPPPEQITSQCWPLCFTDPSVIVVIVPQQVNTNMGSMQVWGGGNNAQVRMHMQRVEDNVQYQFNFQPEGIIYNGDNNPIGLELSGQGKRSGYGPFDVTATVELSRDGEGVFILVNGMPLPSIGLQFEAEGSLTFEEPDPPQ